MSKMSPTRRSALRTVAAAVATAAAATIVAVPPAAMAQTAYPSKPITVIVPFPAGTSPDVVIRLLQPSLGETLGQPIVIENKPGAAGNIGAALVANARGDGHTLLYTVNSVLCANPHLYSSLPFDALRSFAPVAMVGDLGYVVLARPDLPASTFPEFLRYAKANPGKISYGSAGPGGGNHIVAELLSSMAGIEMLHVPGKGSSVTDLIGGHIDITFVPYTVGIPAAQGGKVKALAVSLSKRSSNLPDVPTIAESVPGYLGDGWHAMFAPAATPREAVQKFNAAVNRALQRDDIHNRLTGLSINPLPQTPEQLGQRVASDYAKWGKVIRDAKIKLE